ncbi:leukotoxin LktA family filamentous adhesin [Neptunomonas qingdaonensis]|uniref:leukotoxin LktA family filamentous adhesin n=1 Tax=Neptunomonas qingdaonensis TaxID=1045558 RepID=UPI0018DB56E2|nr:leukotoxin LktA family filamentous adhesin [Neptunomonas qingdaonensis]
MEYPRSKIAVAVAQCINLAEPHRLKAPLWMAVLSAGAMQAVAATPHNIVEDSSTVIKTIGPAGTTSLVNDNNRVNGNAVNVFQHFVVGNGNTVNLIVPGDVSKLVNIVKDSTPEVHGTLNSYKSGALGGDVVFASSHGFLVGPEGVVNVGGLTVRTPSSSDIDNLISGSVTLDEVKSISSTGVITIDGKINAKTGVQLNGQEVVVGTNGVVIAGNPWAATAVNLGDYTPPTELKQNGGTISIASAGGASGDAYDVSLDGSLLADGGITITAPKISVGGDGELDTRQQGALVDGTGDDVQINRAIETGGDVEITASAQQALGFGVATADTQVIVDGEIRAANITITAHSDASSSFIDQPGAGLATNLVAGTFAGASVYVMQADADASISVGGQLYSDADITLGSQALALSESTSIATSQAGVSGSASLAATYNSSNATSSARIKSGAIVEAGGDLTVTAHNEAYLLGSALDIVSTTANKAVLALAIGESDVSSTAIIESGSTLAAENLVLSAENQNSYTVSANATGLRNTEWGVAVAVGDFETNATAQLGASLGSVTDPVGNVSITALDRTVNQQVKSAVTIGSNLAARTVFRPLVTTVSAVQGGADSLIKLFAGDQQTPADSSGKIPFKGGLAFTLNLSDHEAYSYLGTNTAGQLDAPSVHASGNILVASAVDLGTDNATIAGGNDNAAHGDDQGAWRTSAETAISSPSAAAGGGSQTKPADESLALAINLAINSGDSVAEIGDYVEINASALGVSASYKLPAVSTYDKWDSISSVLNKLTGVLGLQNNILTTFANAGASADKDATGGSLNVVANDLDTKAWIGDNATITTTGSGDWSARRILPGSLEAPGILDDSKPFKQITYDFNFNSSVDVRAYTLNESINLAGNLGTLGLIPNGVGTNEQGKMIGAGVSFVQQNVNTVAGIGESTVTANGNVGISAFTDERHVLIAPSSGAGKGMGFNGVLAILNNEVLTHASLSNQARITAGELSVLADYDFGNWSAAGAVNKAEDSAVGVAVAINITQGDTKAFIGDNSEEAAKVDFASGFVNDTQPEPTSPTSPVPDPRAVIVNNVTVRSRASGSNGALALAGALSKEDSGTPGIAEKFEQRWSPLGKKTADAQQGAASGSGDASVSGAAGAAKTDSAASGNSTPTIDENKTGLAGAGSFSVVFNNIDSKAIIDDAVIQGRNDSDVDVSVQALENAVSVSASGSAALSWMSGSQNPPATQNTIAGAIAYQISFNDTLAWIEGSVISNADEVTVQAVHGGELVSIGLSVAVTKAPQAETTTRNGALSVSGAQIYDGTSARIEGSTIESNDDGDESLEVSAYNNASVGVGGGSLYLGGKSGGGLAITFAEINDPSAILAGLNPDSDSNLSATENEDINDVYGGAAVEAVIAGIDTNRSAITNFNDVTVTASALNHIGIGAAGGGYQGVANSAGYAGSFAVGVIGADTKALVDTTDIEGVVTLSINASGELDSDLDQLLTDLGDSDVNDDFDFTGASAIDSTEIFTNDQGAGSSYQYDSEGKRIIAVAGLLQIGKSNKGISYAHTDIKSDTTARLDASTINATGDRANQVSVNARDDSLLYSVAVGVGVATGGNAGVGSVAVNRLNNQVVAEVGDWIGVDSGSISTENLAVTATNDMDLINVAGSVAASTSDSSSFSSTKGLAVALNLVGTNAHETRARIANTDLLAGGDVLVRATSGASDDSNLLVGNAIGVGISASEDAAYAGAVGVNNVDQLVTAGIKNVGTGLDADGVAVVGDTYRVHAYDYTDSVATAWIGTLSVGGDAGGIAVATNRVDSDVTAEVLGDGLTRGSSTLNLANLDIRAARDNWLLTIDAGIANGGQDALAASVGTGVIDGDVTARIADDATVTASNNVLVNADAKSVNIVGSGSIGFAVGDNAGAVAISTTLEYGKTLASIDNSSVTARGADGNNVLRVDTGELSNYGTLPDLSTSGQTEDDNDADTAAPVDRDALTTGFSLIDQDKETEDASGLVVNATSRTKQQAITIAGSASASKGFAANVSTNASTSSAEALVTGSEINSGVAGADVRVRANAHEAGLSIAVGGSISGSAGVGGVATNSQKKAAQATVDDSNINADSVVIGAHTSKVAQAVSAGIAVGTGDGGIGGAASVVITEQSGSTRSWLRGGTMVANAMEVSSDRRQEANVAAGSAGIGPKAGIGFGLAVNLIGDDSSALIGNNLSDANDSRNTVVQVSDVTVDADRFENVNSYAFGAGVSGGVGAAAMINVTEFSGETRAAIHGKVVGNAYTTQVRSKDGTSEADTVSVNGQEILRANHAAFGIGVGAKVGIGAVANVALGRSQVYGEIVGSDIQSGLLDIDATAQREADLLSVAGAAGQAAAAVSIGVALFGQGDSTAEDGTNAEDEFDPSRSVANDALTSGYLRLNTQLDSAELAVAEAGPASTVADGSTPTTVTTTASGQSLRIDGESVTAARISGGRIDVGSLSVNGRTRLHTLQGLGAAQASAVGFAGVVGITRMYDINVATVDTDLNANSVVVGALIEDLSAEDAAGEARSFVVGLGGFTTVVNYLDVRSRQQVVAGVAGATGTDVDDLTVSAKDTTELRAGDLGAGKPTVVTDSGASVNLGGTAVGVSYGYANKDSDVDVWLGRSGRTVDGYNNITVIAESSGMVKSTAFALSGGIAGGAQGVITDAEDNSDVNAAVYGTIGTGSGVTSISAQSVPELYSNSFGVTVSGGYSMGASFAYATTDSTATAEITDGVIFTGDGNVILTSETGDASDADYETANATALAASGGLILGAAGSEARSTNESESVARVGDNVTIPNANFEVYARHTGVQYGDANGYFFGALAGGYQTGVAQSYTSTRVEFGMDPNATLGRTGNLILDASSSNANQAFTTAGGGGVFSGSAAISVVDAGNHKNGNAAAAVLIDDWFDGYRVLPVDAGNIVIKAENNIEFFAGTDATTVSAVGGSGAESDVDISTNTQVTLGENVGFDAFDIDIDARNKARQVQVPFNRSFESSIRAGGGGGANGTAGLSYQNIKSLSARVNIGENAVLKVSPLVLSSSADVAGVSSLSSSLNSADHRIAIDASTDFIVFDQAILEVGGALQGAGTESDVDVNARNSVTLNDGVQLLNGIGEVGVGTYSKGNAAASANVTVWAIAGVAGGTSTSTVDVDNDVTLGEGVIIDSIEEINIFAGRSSDGLGQNQIFADARTNVYNWTAVPIPAGNTARSRITLENNVSFADSYQLGSDGDVNIGALKGQVNATHSGIERNPYLELFSAETTFGSSRSTTNTNQLVFGDLGQITAGQYAYQYVRIDESGRIVDNLARFGEAQQLNEKYSSRAELQAFIDDLDRRITELQAWDGSATTTSGVSVGEAVAELSTQPEVDAYIAELTGLKAAATETDYIAELDAEIVLLQAWDGVTTLTVSPVDGSSTSGSSSGASVTASTPGVNPFLAEIGDLQAQKVLLSGVVNQLSGVANFAVEVSNVRASAGNINLLAGDISMTGAGNTSMFTAKGNATIEIDNLDDQHLILNEIRIANKTGGNVFVSGGATSLSSSHVDKQQGALIPGTTTGQFKSGIYVNHQPVGPDRLDADVIVSGKLSNVLSTVNIVVGEGDLIQQGVIEANSIELDVAGIYLVNNPNEEQALTRTPSSLLNFVSRWKPQNAEEVVQYYLNAKYSDKIGDTNLARFNEWFSGRALSYENVVLPPDPYFGRPDKLNIYFNWGFSNANDYLAGDALVFNMLSDDSSRGSTKWGFKPVLNKQSLLSQTATYNQVKGTPGFGTSPESVIGEKVLINAARLDINGTIVVGKNNNWSVDVGSGFDAEIQRYISDTGLSAGNTITFTPGETKTVRRENPDYQPISLFPDHDGRRYLTDIYDFDIGKTAGASGIELKYDVATGKLEVDDIPVSGGGYAEIRARITSTGEEGRIKIRDGLGQISINNDSNTELVVGTLSAGDDPRGVVRITDLNKPVIRTSENSSGYESQWYVHSPGSQIERYTTTALATAYTPADYVESLGVAGTTSTTSYNPLRGQLYYFSETATVAREVDLPPDGYFAKYPGTVGSWAYTTDWPTDPDEDPNFTDYYTNCTYKPQACAGGVVTDYLLHKYSIGSQRTTGFSAWNLSYAPYYGSLLVATDPAITIAKQVQVRTETYVKADHSIALEFTGSATGSIGIDSKTSLQLTGNIFNPRGNTFIATEADFTNSGAAVITSDVIDITAFGNIGEDAAPLTVRTNELSLRSSEGSLNFDASALNSDNVALGELSARYDIVGTVDKSIVARDASSLVSADTVDLTSETGSIGRVGLISDPTSYEFIRMASTGAVSLKSDGDVAVSQARGDMAVLAIDARNSVVISLGDGDLINAIGQQAKSAKELAYQASVWDSLNLLDGSAGERYVSAYENQFNNKYNGYWLIRQRLSDASDAGFSLDVAFVDALGIRYGETDLTALTALVKADYDALNGWFADQQATPEVYTNVTDAIGQEQKGILAGFDYGSLFDSYDENYSLTIAPGSNIYDRMVDGATWKQSQLDISISAAALSADASGQLSGRAANITAPNIKLLTSSGSVGQNLSDLVFSIPLDDTASVTDAQKAALLSAGPGDITSVVTDTLATLTVRQVDPVKVDTLNALNVSARDEIYIEAANSLLLGALNSATNDIRVVVDGQISAQDGAINLTARDLFLANTQGDIGSSSQAVSLQLGGALRQAGAAADLFLSQTGGDLRVGSIAAGGVLSLTNEQDILANDSNQFMSASGITLNVGASNLGAADSRLNLSVLGDDGLTVTAGNAWLNITNTPSLTLGNMLVNQRLDLVTVGDVDITGALRAASLELDVDAAVTGTSSGSVTVDDYLRIQASSIDLAQLDISTGAATLQTMGGDLSVGSVRVSNGDLGLLATGELILNGDIGVQSGSLVGDAQRVQMASGTRLGTSGDLTLTAIESARLDELQVGGDLAVSVANALNAAEGRADFEGNVSAQAITVTANAGIDIEANLLGTTVTLNAGAGSLNAASASMVSSRTSTTSLTGLGIAFAADSQLDSAGDLSINAGAEGVSLGRVSSGSLTMVSGGDIDLNNDVTMANTSSLQAVGALTGDNIRVSNGDLGLLATGELILNGDIDVQSGSLVGDAQRVQMASGTRLGTSGDLTLTAIESARLDELQVGGDLAVSVANALNAAEGRADFQGNVSAQAITVTANAGIDLEANLLGTTVTLDAGAGSLNAASASMVSSRSSTTSLTGLGIAFAADSQLHSAGDLSINASAVGVSLGRVSSDGRLTMVSGGDTVLNGDISVANAAVLQANGGITLSSGKSLVSANEMGFITADLLELLAGSEVNGGSEVTVVAAGIAMGQGSRITAGGPVSINTRDDMLLSFVETDWDGEDALRLTSGAKIEGREDSLLHLKAVGDNAQSHLSAATGIGSPLVVDLPWLAAQTRAGDIKIVAERGLYSPFIDAGNGNVELSVSGDLEIGELIGNPYLWIDGGIHVERVVLDEGTLASRERIEIDQIDLFGEGPLALESALIDVSVDSKNSENTTISLTGFEGLAADSIDLTVRNTNKLSITKLFTNSGALTFDGDLRLAAGRVESNLEIESSALILSLDNINPAAQYFDGQLVTPNGEFWLAMTGNEVRTNAVVTRYRDPVVLFFTPPEDFESGTQALNQSQQQSTYQRLSVENLTLMDMYKDLSQPLFSGGTRQFPAVAFDGSNIQTQFINSLLEQTLPAEDDDLLEIAANAGPSSPEPIE